MQVISTNVAVRRPDPSGRHEFSGIDKQPQDFIDLAAPGPHYGDGSGVRGDIIGDTQHHGGNDKAVYAYSREELDYWQSKLSRPLASGGFGENLTTQGIDLSALLINQRVRIGTAVLEVSVPRQPCATFAGWLGERGWLKRWTARGDCGTYLRIMSPGRIRPGDAIELDNPPSHGITMRMAFAAKMGDRALARRVVDAGCLPTHQQNSLRT